MLREIKKFSHLNKCYLISVEKSIVKVTNTVLLNSQKKSSQIN